MKIESIFHVDGPEKDEFASSDALYAVSLINNALHHGIEGLHDPRGLHFDTAATCLEHSTRTLQNILYEIRVSNAIKRAKR